MGKKIGVYELGKSLGEGSFGKYVPAGSTAPSQSLSSSPPPPTKHLTPSSPPPPPHPPYTRVKYAINAETGEAVAIKVLIKEKIQQQGMGQQVKKEISIMKQLRHPHVVQLREVLASKSKIFIVLQLVTGGELFVKIVSEGRFPEDQARFYFRQLIAGVEYCHSQGVCHRDLKPENLLLDEAWNLKISDFGLSALYGGVGDSRAALLHTTCGTPNYVAPEVLADRGYDGRTADVWSCGVILYVLLAAYLPFDEPIMSNLFRKIQAAEFSYPAWFSPDVRALLDDILVADPTRRATIAAIKAHPWFTAGGQYRPSPPPKAKDVRSPRHEDVAAAIQEGVVDRLSKTTTGPPPLPPGGRDEGGQGEDQESQDWLNRRVSTKGRLVLHGGSDRELTRLLRFPVLSELGATGDVGRVVNAIAQALREMGCEVRVHGDYEKVKATKLTPKGMIGIIFQVQPRGGEGGQGIEEEDEEDDKEEKEKEEGAAAASSSSSSASPHLVEVRRGRGDIMEYAQFLSELVDCKLHHVLEAPPEAPLTGSPPGAK